MNRLPSLPVGTTSFPTMRKFNEIYVDKTDLIHELAGKRSKVFLSRPRRFGKTLLVSTFESLFANGLRDFQGLAIEKLWTDQTYRVVRLDFSCLREFEDFPDFEAAFWKCSRDRFESTVALPLLPESRRSVYGPTGWRALRKARWCFSSTNTMRRSRPVSISPSSLGKSNGS